MGLANALAEAVGFEAGGLEEAGKGKTPSTAAEFKREAEKMKEKGYRFKVEVKLRDRIDYLYAKTSSAAAQLARENPGSIVMPIDAPPFSGKARGKREDSDGEREGNRSLEEAGRGKGSTAYFASLIDSAVRNLRDQAHDMLDKASDIENAWKKWDVKKLVTLGVLNRSQATQLKAALEGSVTRFFAGSRRHESDSSDVDLNALFSEAASEVP